jgi:predicted nucleic acid-binding protein
MPPAGLIDTGAIVAIVNSDESRHTACLEALASVQMPLLTTEAVLTELFHLVFARSLSLERAWRFVRSGALSVRSMGDADLPALHALMAQYNDRPMDFADATLVHLAARESISLILTVDHDDFETYRIGGRKRFTILPDRKRSSRGH